MAFSDAFARFGGITRRAALCGGVGGIVTLAAAQAQAQAETQAVRDAAVEIPFVLDPDGRAVVDVMLNGQGPFRLIVDTGATATVVSPLVAQTLGLTATHIAPVHGITGVTEAPIARLVSLDLGGQRFAGIEAALLGGRVMGSADGLLGMGAWRNHRMTLDFAAGAFRVGASAGERARASLTRAEGALLHGTLLLTPARVGSVDAIALIDTGATHTLMNPAMALALPGADDVLGLRAEAPAATVGSAQSAAPAVLSVVEVGNLRVRRLVAFQAPMAVFDLFASPDEPALVLGMDVWRHALALSVDYPRAELQLRLDDETGAVRRGTGSRIPDDL